MRKLLPSTLLLFVLGLVLVTGCRSTYYAAYEKIGVYKRDLLKKDVKAARDAQAGAQGEFKDAMTRLKEITKFEGGELEKRHDALKRQYEECVSRAETVHKRVREVETVSADLFGEWEKEIQQIGTPALRQASQQQLSVTRQKYGELHSALKSAEQSMDPVLRQFHDYVLFLKHNLNAQAIASLKGETASIQGEISRLIDEMNQSIARADEFIKSMP
jgi:hypothetical protein